MLSLNIFRKCQFSPVYMCQRAAMSAESRRNNEAIETYNKLRVKPLKDTFYSQSEKKSLKKMFDEVQKYRKATAEKFEPAKLHMVWRVGELVNRPYWEKDTIKELGLDGDRREYAIVKNTPEMNKLLWSVKHLIRIKPITFPNGLPKEGDYTGTYLKQTGEFIISPKLKVDPQLLLEDPEAQRKKLNFSYIREEMRLKWDKAYPKLY